MIQGKTKPAGCESQGGLHRLMQRKILTCLGGVRICDTLLMFAAVTASWAACSWVLHLGYLIAKGLL